MHAPPETPLPNFFLAGVPKAGSTSLYRYMGQHPSIYLSPIKEPTFFGFEDILSLRLEDGTEARMRRSIDETRRYLEGPSLDPRHVGMVAEWEDYLKLFRDARAPAIGEGSVSYFWLPGAAAAMAQRVPGARLLFILRDPAERLFSHYLAEYYGQDVSFRARIIDGMENPESRSRRWLEVARYGTNLQRFLDHFPREQMHFILHEDLRAEPLRVLADVFRFLGVDPDVPVDVSHRHNEPSIARFPRLNAFRWKVFGRTPVSAALPPPLRNLFFRFYRKSRREARMEAADRQLVVDYTGDEVRRTAEIIGRDLTSWLR